MIDNVGYRSTMSILAISPGKPLDRVVFIASSRNGWPIAERGCPREQRSVKWGILGTSYFSAIFLSAFLMGSTLVLTFLPQISHTPSER